ncbi:MAG: YvcK family protein [Vampirovibrio sp.]|nr:YvcK family protein [Vampirovibrio sp.]
MKRLNIPRPWYRHTMWLLPGLSFKRWILLGALGIIFLGIGLALLFNLQPATQIIEFLKYIGRRVPREASGPMLAFGGFLLFYVGLRKTWQTFSNALDYGAGSSGLLEALYQKHKLARGPRIVAVGGGTGLSTLLRGIKHYTSNITAVVTVGDDGGSSGRLREEQGVIPPGDIRNCISALADEEQLITELFQYRFKTGHGLEGHSFGNLFLTAMCQITGDMFSAIKESSKVLKIRGRVLPSTLDNVTLSAEMEDGRVVTGESQIPKAEGKILRLKCDPVCPKALPEVLEAIENAELVVLGPGSLYTSVVPNLLMTEISEAVLASPAPKVYVSNIMTQPGETDAFSVADHIQVIYDHAGHANIVDAVFVNNSLPEPLVEKYRQTNNSVPVALDRERCHELGVTVIETMLIDETETQTIRHHPKRLARSIIHWFKQHYPQEKSVSTQAPRNLSVAATENDMPPPTAMKSK